MAFTDFSRQDFSSIVPVVGGQESTDEERKRRLAMMAGMGGEASFSDMASQYLGNRVDQAQQNVQNAGQMVSDPQQAIQERIAGGPVAPAQPQVQQQPQPQPQAQAIAPVSPNEQVNIPQLPQPGPGVQVAGPMQLPGQVPQEQYSGPSQGAEGQTVGQVMLPPPAPISWTEQVSKIADDEKGLAQYIGNASNPPEGIKFAKQQLQQMWNKTQSDKKAESMVNSAVESGNLLPLMKEIKKSGEEGSYVKAYLYNRLGLNDLAKIQQQKLGAGASYSSAVGPDGQRALIKYDANGLPLKGFDEKGQELKPESLAAFASGAIGSQTKSFMLPSVHGTPVQNAQGQTGLMMYDPATRTSYVQVGNQKMSTQGWTTMSQNPQSVYGAQGAGQQGKQAATTGVQQPPMPPMAGQPQPMAQPQPQVQGAPQAQPQAQGQAAPQVTAQASPQGGVKLTPQKTAGGGAVVTQRPGESFSSYEQRKKASEEQTTANIQAGKEIRVAEAKPPAEARGKIEAKDINNQAFADSSYGLIKPINDLIKKSTGSGIGANIDVLAKQFGVGTEGAKAIAQLRPLVYPILANIPRFEGPQSEYDVQLYQTAAGDFANPKEPPEVRLAALQGMITLLKKYDKAGKNDWTFGEGKPAGSGTTSSGNKYKKVQ